MGNVALNWVLAICSWLVPDTSEREDDDGSPRTKEIFFVTAATEDGVVYRHFETFDSYELADTLASRIFAQAAVWSGALHNPNWRYFRTEYGSQAHCNNWRFLEAEMELADREAELGAEAFETLSDEMKMTLTYGDHVV